MKLLVRVIEARDIPPMDPNGFSDPYVKLQLGRQKFRSKVIKKCLNPSWCEEFTFKVEDLKEEIIISVFDEDKFKNDDFVGQIKMTVSQIFEANDHSLGTVWYTLHPKNKKARDKEYGEILLTICLSHNNTLLDLPSLNDPSILQKKYSDTLLDSPSRSSPRRSFSPRRLKELVSSDEKQNSPKLGARFAQIFNKSIDMSQGRSSVESSESLESVKSVISEPKSEDQSSDINFENLIKSMETKNQENEFPSSLPGGIVVDQMYGITPRELNTVLFSPDSDFLKSSSDAQGSTELQIGPWRFENDESTLKRVVSYTKSATKLVKALKATEEQMYLKCDGNSFAVLSSASTPDAPYGKTFKAEVLYCITPGPENPSSRLVISWRMNFVQSTIMKSMIEGGARTGIKESFDQYQKLLSQNVKPLDVKNTGSEKDQLLASIKVEPLSDWKLAVQYLGKFSVILTFLMAVYLMVHIWLAVPDDKSQGLEFDGLDLPDSIGEFIVCGVVVLMGKRVVELMSRFMKARSQKGTDHGIKAQGDGWLLTIGLIEGTNLSPVDSTGFSDPHVVFTCNGKTRTSSIKFQKSNPIWNEIFEFDATSEPPSMLEVEVFDFDGPFNEATSLGRAEINFLKSNISDLSDIWIPLQGKLAQSCQSKLHLRIFLNDTSGKNVVKDYITKMEKEVGKKIRLRSPQTNWAFQKLFLLPPEEFLINDFACHLKRRMPLQGRLFLSARIIGFHADLFGRKTNFFFLWEDIEEIQVIPPTLSSMGSPIIIMTLKPGRGLDARHGAKTQDEEGRLKFHFDTFFSFDGAHRTIMALWRAKSLTPEQKVQIVEQEAEANNVQIIEELEAKSDENEAKPLQTAESGSFLGVQDVKLSLIYSSILSLPTSFFMELFGGGEIERRIFDRAGCLNYSHSPWESEKPDVYQRQLYYQYDKRISRSGGEVTSTQQKSCLIGTNGWLIEEVMTFQGVPLGDYFTLHLRYQVDDLPSRSAGCSVQVFIGIAWLKYTRQQKSMTKSIISNQLERLKVMFGVLEKEYISGE